MTSREKAAAAREVYLPNHRTLSNAELLQMPATGLFTPCIMFLCTYAAKVENLHIDFRDLGPIMCENPHGCLLAVNSNFCHAAQPGYEHYIKTPDPAPPKPVEDYTPSRGRRRKKQGDGTCFNSAVELVVRIDGVAPDKVYLPKCFPTTGEVQVPGVIRADLSDGPEVLRALVDYLDELQVADPPSDDEDEDPLQRQRQQQRVCKDIVIRSHGPNMLNYKFRLRRNSPRILIDLRSITQCFRALEASKAIAGAALTEAQADQLRGWEDVLPPFFVRETKPPTDGIKMAFRFTKPGQRGGTRRRRVNVFQSGKVNILGAETVEDSEKIYGYFVRLFAANWSKFVCLQPRRDAELRRAAPPPPQPQPQPPTLPVLRDSDVDSILSDVFSDDATVGGDEDEDDVDDFDEFDEFDEFTD